MQPGHLHERSLARQGIRKQQGAYYTPADVVDGVLDLALEPLLRARSLEGPDAVASLRVIDPACGTGQFVVAVAERVRDCLVGLGLDRVEAADLGVRCVWGIDVDATALSLCRSALGALSPVGGGRRFRRGDALLEPGLVREGTFDLVVGNPPFLSQLGRSTARPLGQGDALRARFGGVIAAYTDPAAIFALLAHRLSRPDGGVAALVEPISFLTARDAAGIRAALLQGSCLTDLWLLDERVFDADVEVCVPVLERGIGRGDGSTATLVHRGRDRLVSRPVAAPSGLRSWSHLLADVSDLPQRTLEASGTLGDLAIATADFRDQYYGLAGHVIDRLEGDDRTHPKLVTAGLIDPADLRWGRQPTTFNKVRYRHPRVDLAGLEPKLRAWASGRLVPKVLLAPQTRVLEAVVDPAGTLLPSVPVVTATPIGSDPVDLWRVAAVLTCPAVAAEATRRHLGSGRNARSIRLRAGEVLELPVPQDLARWRAAADLLAAMDRSAPADEHLDRLAQVGRAMDEAYGLAGDDELLDWWLSAVPRREALPAW